MDKFKVAATDEGYPLMGVTPADNFGVLKLDEHARLLATLDDETIDRIANRVVDLLFERNRRGEGK